MSTSDVTWKSIVGGVGVGFGAAFFDFCADVVVEAKLNTRTRPSKTNASKARTGKRKERALVFRSSNNEKIPKRIVPVMKLRENRGDERLELMANADNLLQGLRMVVT